MCSPAPIATLPEDHYVIVIFTPVDGTHKLTMGVVLIEWLDFEEKWQEAM
jgi:hypothetical protein